MWALGLVVSVSVWSVWPRAAGWAVCRTAAEWLGTASSELLWAEEL